MAYSTEHYFVKPVIPKIRLGLSIGNIPITKFDSKIELLIGDTFSESTIFYLINDNFFRKRVKDYRRLYEYVLIEYERNNEFDLIKQAEVRLDNLDKIICGLSRSSVNLINLQPKELNYWVLQTFKHRRVILKKLYPKKQFSLMNELFSTCNVFLKELEKISIKIDDSLNYFFDIGSNLDWFLLNITECPFHTENSFKQLFSGYVLTENDLIALSGAFNILLQKNAIDLYRANDPDFMEKVAVYKALFQNLLKSGNRIINLKDMEKQAENNVKLSLARIEGKKQLKAKIKEIQSMHEIAIDRKIHDIE